MASPSLVTVKMAVSVDSVPMIGVFQAANGQLPASMMLKDAIATSPRNEDGSSTFMSLQVNPGYYFIACGLKNSGNADAQVVVFCNNPLTFCFRVCSGNKRGIESEKKLVDKGDIVPHLKERRVETTKVIVGRVAHL